MSHKLPIDVSIIVPCWNEQKNLERGVLTEIENYLENQPYIWEVIIVDDGSTDRSRAFVANFIRSKPGFLLSEIPHSGKPAAIWHGIRMARGEVILFTDMDQSTPISELNELLPFYDQGYDIVIGSRGSHRDGTSHMRRLGSLIFRIIRQLLILRHISDTQCGFKSFRRAAALQTFPRLKYFKNSETPAGWKVTAFDVELLFLSERKGYRIKEVPVKWMNRDISDTKGLAQIGNRYVRESFEMAREIINIRVNQLRGVYD